jgi:hypothetical protein
MLCDFPHKQKKHSYWLRKVIYMVQVDVTVNFEGKSYLTNVITNWNTTDEEISRLAFEQVEKQWKK